MHDTFTVGNRALVNVWCLMILDLIPLTHSKTQIDLCNMLLHNYKLLFNLKRTLHLCRFWLGSPLSNKMIPLKELLIFSVKIYRCESQITLVLTPVPLKARWKVSSLLLLFELLTLQFPANAQLLHRCPCVKIVCVVVTLIKRA